MGIDTRNAGMSSSSEVWSKKRACGGAGFSDSLSGGLKTALALIGAIQKAMKTAV